MSILHISYYITWVFINQTTRCLTNLLIIVLFRHSITAISCALLQCSWLMNSAENRCAFVRAEYVQILILLLQSTSSYIQAESDAEEELELDHMVNNITVDDDDAVVSDTVEHLHSSDLRCLDSTVDNEMRLLLESDGVEKHCDSEVSISHFSLISACLWNTL